VVFFTFTPNALVIDIVAPGIKAPVGSLMWPCRVPPLAVTGEVDVVDVCANARLANAIETATTRRAKWANRGYTVPSLVLS
jgi:hypothetical protein